MKANVPERIWINPTIDIPKLSGVMDKNSIEYTRTNAFIEKARKYFIKELPNFRSFMESGTTFIKNFENFIRGE